ncbi:MAG TPA: CpsB/CapC family capsule biosynthesis tyrosine phosphatase [Thermomicrobiales bacterium]|nr:CpsB/CapC family capsule biosynthesis tyrosine phosphatase [Thermomicrobiales bacterium]
MIDLHLHILPGVDDGPRTLREAIAMLDWFAAAGYTRLVATPHLMEPLSREYAEAVRASFDQVEEQATERGLTLDAGYEHMVANDLPARLTAGETSTLAGSKAILIEFPFAGWDYSADRVLFDVQQRGFRAVLAHPERYVEAHTRPDLVEALAERGVVFQITLAAIAGTYGPEVRSMAGKLLTWCVTSELPFVLATDAHSMGRRLTDSLAGRAWIERNIAEGESVLTWAGSVVPESIISDQPIPSLREWIDQNPAPRNQPTGWWRRIPARNPLVRS